MTEVMGVLRLKATEDHAKKEIVERTKGKHPLGEGDKTDRQTG